MALWGSGVRIPSAPPSHGIKDLKLADRRYRRGDPGSFPAERLAALVSAWQAGAISRDTLLHNLRQGEILPPGRTGEHELNLISTEANFLQKETKVTKKDPD